MRVGAAKLKISLTKDESESYNITADEKEFDKNEIRSTVSKILKDAKSKCGFDIGDSKVLIQIYPSVDDGVDIFVTKLTGLRESERRVVFGADNVTSLERVRSVFRFDDLENLILAARAVKNKSVPSSAYLGDDGCYYICIKEDSINGATELLALYEFGEKLSDLPYDIERERGKLLCSKDAIALFSKL